MNNKEKYYLALKQNNGRLNEMDLGESLGFEDERTRQIIVELMEEYRIAYLQNGNCNYSLMKGVRGKNRKNLF
ncbi:hypothetical protein JQC67_12270 [Aurantibacter crassamenti]|uniref:hypothetical protein n=1 Tax=Aurantibacter crassamenti TaxID=1837375 RepID=UPI001939D0BD|nr:hypothetical protein [Aurantibacter crassamenti]MBM1106918.1 hypothetical protein [Aurantibacter crassamenti]